MKLWSQMFQIFISEKVGSEKKEVKFGQNLRRKKQIVISMRKKIENPQKGVTKFFTKLYSSFHQE